METAIETKKLNKHFGPLHVVRDMSFKVAYGEVLGFLGPNGAGKSTTMKMITGFLEPTSGTVTVCGHDVIDEPIQVKERIGYLPEGVPLYGEMTPRAFLRFVAAVRNLKAQEKERRINDVVRKIRLEAVLDQRIETLSKGYKRRVGLAQALVHDPEILVLDEPTDGLDPNQKHEVRTLITEMAKDKAIVISTHILEEVDAVCTRAIIIAQGELLFDGSPEDLAAQSHFHNAVSLTIMSTLSQKDKAKLAKLDGIASLEELTCVDGATRLLIFPEKGQSIVSIVSDYVQSNGWLLSELHVESGRLDEVFRTITTQSNGEGESRLS
ncbi:MAG: ABC transporter ATP-binding protein [Gammaproteobacteria bacterium]|nr:ABC transporter ATP-binding protein [Gammaproteobacteria bacterium]MCI0591535.1 ABC transporter ATP-binding protein [Gammaproteobacteria bacterium]